jgi:putative flavoprotein involved in K+ transport
VLALTWRIQTINGADAIAAGLRSAVGQARPSSFRIPANRAAPRTVTRAGRDTIEAIFTFDTAEGTASGVLRLIPNAEAPLKAWTLLTALDELHIAEARCPRGRVHAHHFRGPNWLDFRREAATYADRDPVVLVVGGGQAGLSIAAQLTALDVDTLIVDREGRIGDTWRKRYHALTLHNQTHVNHLPFMPFPPNWPTYIPKDKLAGWFEAYVESLELNCWPGTEFGAAITMQVLGIGASACGGLPASIEP